jgi:hypothetical protein
MRPKQRRGSSRRRGVRDGVLGRVGIWRVDPKALTATPPDLDSYNKNSFEIAETRCLKSLCKQMKTGVVLDCVTTAIVNESRTGSNRQKLSFIFKDISTKGKSPCSQNQPPQHQKIPSKAVQLAEQRLALRVPIPQHPATAKACSA